MQPEQTLHKLYVLDEHARILVVDDDPILREFASVYLSTPMAEVETAADASTALDLLLTGKFDIALVDIEMPGLDGFQLVERVRAHEKLRHIPLVMLTVHEGIASIDRAYHLGATSFTTKPVNWRQLSYHLRYVLRASRMQAEAREAQARAEESIALRANSLSTIRNEFNNSLNSIIEFANRIANGGALDPSNPHVRHAQTIAAASKHLLRIMQHAEASSASGALHERPLQLPGAFAETQDPLPQEAGSTASAPPLQPSNDGAGREELTRWPRHFKRLRKSINGNVAVTFALAIPVVFGAVAAAVDYGSFATERTRLQAAADAAALNAARELSSTNTLMIANLAENYARATLGASGSDATVQTQLIPPDSVEVRISKDLKPILSRLLSNTGTHLAVRAVAKMYAGAPLCVLGLDPGAAGTVQLQQLGRMTAVNCSINSNSTDPKGLISQDLAVMISLQTCSAGGFSESTPINFLPPPKTDCPRIPDPLASRPAPSVGPCGFVNTVIGVGTTTLNPGIYCGGITVSGLAKVHLNPGVYVIRDGPLAVSLGGTLDGQNVGFYLTGSGSTISWDATSHISFTAPKDGPLAGMLIYEDPSSPALRQHTISSNDARTLLGTIYMPQGKLVIASTSLIADLSSYTVIVARMLQVQSTANLVLNSNYDLTDIPVPIGLGPRLFNKITLSQ